MDALFLFVGLVVGWYAERILWELKRIRGALKPPQKSSVVTPNIARPIRSTTTGVVSPKTPARLQFEFDQEMKRQAGIIE